MVQPQGEFQSDNINAFDDANIEDDDDLDIEGSDEAVEEEIDWQARAKELMEANRKLSSDFNALKGQNRANLSTKEMLARIDDRLSAQERTSDALFRAVLDPDSAQARWDEVNQQNRDSMSHRNFQAQYQEVWADLQDAVMDGDKIVLDLRNAPELADLRQRWDGIISQRHQGGIDDANTLIALARLTGEAQRITGQKLRENERKATQEERKRRQNERKKALDEAKAHDLAVNGSAGSGSTEFNTNPIVSMTSGLTEAGGLSGYISRKGR